MNKQKLHRAYIIQNIAMSFLFIGMVLVGSAIFYNNSILPVIGAGLTLTFAILHAIFNPRKYEFHMIKFRY